MNQITSLREELENAHEQNRSLENSNNQLMQENKQLLLNKKITSAENYWVQAIQSKLKRISTEKLEKHISNQQQAFETEKHKMKQCALQDLTEMKTAMAAAARHHQIQTSIILHSKSIIRSKLNDSLAEHAQTRNNLEQSQKEHNDYKQ